MYIKKPSKVGGLTNSTDVLHRVGNSFLLERKKEEEFSSNLLLSSVDFDEVGHINANRTKGRNF
jgi:hypothetical protein